VRDVHVRGLRGWLTKAAENVESRDACLVRAGWNRLVSVSGLEVADTRDSSSRTVSRVDDLERQASAARRSNLV
jgi:hypothetical protein